VTVWGGAIVTVFDERSRVGWPFLFGVSHLMR